MANVAKDTLLNPLFFLIGPAQHHLYYLVPLIRETPNRQLCIIDTSPAYVAMVKKTYPDFNIVSFNQDLPKLIDFFNSFTILLHSNAYPLFEDHIRPKLSPGKVIVNVQHFSPVKFVDDLPYIMSNFAWDVTVAAGRKDLELLHRHGVMELGENDYTNPFWMTVQGNPVQVILGGNLRIRQYWRNRPNPHSIFHALPKLDPNKKTILYMPTFSFNITRTKSDYCSMPFFNECLRNMKNPQDYNFIFKPHPNIVYEKHMLESLIKTATSLGLNFHVELFGSDYLHFMEIADLLVSDRTSAAVDYFFFDKPVFFLDHNHQCPPELTFDDITNSYWTYQMGQIISKDNIKRIDQLIAENLAQDRFGHIRARCLQYMFADDFTPAQILAAIRTHPNLNQS